MKHLLFLFPHNHKHKQNGLVKKKHWAAAGVGGAAGQQEGELCGHEWSIADEAHQNLLFPEFYLCSSLGCSTEVSQGPQTAN